MCIVGFSMKRILLYWHLIVLRRYGRLLLKLGIPRHLAWMTFMLGDDLVYGVLNIVNSNTMPLAWNDTRSLMIPKV